ncbi:hypothetical protein NPIL_395341 [Nephila pilipes]|uniref:Uncharacterized protein n=1 Tax=Nephila pilipes TaxID=299642 RepID=A0A8X6US63_NEPPI|nr:hypothetical protein NPIL_395341 [Nephila pilipes]
MSITRQANFQVRDRQREHQVVAVLQYRFLTLKITVKTIRLPKTEERIKITNASHRHTTVVWHSSSSASGENSRMLSPITESLKNKNCFS